MEIIKESVLQFEYKIMTYYGLMEAAVTQDILKKTNTSNEDVLNELGKDGWELFTILQGKENCIFIFKRSKWVEKKAQPFKLLKNHRYVCIKPLPWTDHDFEVGKIYQSVDDDKIVDDSGNEHVFNDAIQCPPHPWFFEILESNDWNKEDEDMLKSCLKILYARNDTETMCTKWLKSLKSRVQPQVKREWENKDEIIRTSLLKFIQKYQREKGWSFYDGTDVHAIIDWLNDIDKR